MLTIEKVQSGKKHRFENKLIHEASPYLLQHAHNPVNWYPWGDEAFEKAKAENKPVLLSIGYSTCHWCHVMEHESFEDEEIAKVMNDNYVSIKVDREQRPDVDSIYMSVVQSMTGHGGWPMTVWLTPERKPFYGGTYFPARAGDRGGQPGFMELLLRLADLYRQHPAEITQRSQEIAVQIAKHMQRKQGGKIPDEKVFDLAYAELSQNYDSRYGGFGFAPKFPSPSNLQFLLQHGYRTSNSHAVDMALNTLRGMLKGGIYDQLGGGFHRYSVDTYWLVPHFEKMLYDQAQIVLTMTDAYQLSQDPEFKRVVTETLDYVLCEMTHSEGGFYSATDADSEGEEGKFFVWTIDEITKVLDAATATLWIEFYGMTVEGNFLDPHKPASAGQEGQNILFISEDLTSFAKKKGLDAVELEKKFRDAKEKLLKIRDHRVPPLTDDKIITSWNGLMIAAFARAGFIFNEARYVSAAEKATDFISRHLWKQNRLYRSMRQGKVDVEGFLDDHACLTFGLLQVFQADGQMRWLKFATEIQDRMIQLFWDEENGGFFSTTGKELFAREKPYYDGAEPSGTLIAAGNLLKLSALLKNESYRTYAEKIFETFAQTISEHPTFLPQMLVGLRNYQNGMKEVVVVDADDGKFSDLLNVARNTYLSNQVLIHINFKHDNELAAQIPTLTEKMNVTTSTAYVCQGYVCQAPTSDPETFQKQLNSR